VLQRHVVEGFFGRAAQQLQAWWRGQVARSAVEHFRTAVGDLEDGPRFVARMAEAGSYSRLCPPVWRLVVQQAAVWEAEREQACHDLLGEGQLRDNRGIVGASESEEG